MVRVVTGALMVIGMKYGRTRLDDLAAKDLHSGKCLHDGIPAEEPLAELHGFDRA